MSISVYAFIEIQRETAWELFRDFDKRYHEPPFNLAPLTWGEFNFSKYYEFSQEKGLPKNLSPDLAQIIEQQKIQFGDDAINRPSWISYEEILDFYQQDTENLYAHFDFKFLGQLKEKQKQDIRVVFWCN